MTQTTDTPMSTAPAEKDRVVDMLGSEASALSKYQSVFVGREGLLATLKYDLVMMLASGTRGALSKNVNHAPRRQLNSMTSDFCFHELDLFSYPCETTLRNPR